MSCADSELRSMMAARAIRSKLLRLKWLAAATRFEIALRRHDRALKLAYKYGYNPAEPRDERGRWTDANGNPVATARICLAGEIPTGVPPEIPEERPPTTRLRNTLVRGLARALGPRIWIVAELSAAQDEALLGNENDRFNRSPFSKHAGCCRGTENTAGRSAARVTQPVYASEHAGSPKGGKE